MILLKRCTSLHYIQNNVTVCFAMINEYLLLSLASFFITVINVALFCKIFTVQFDPINFICP